MAGPVDVVLLGGGASHRMGSDKASLPVAGRRLIDHVLDDLAVQNVGRVVVVAPDRLEVPDWVLQTMEYPPGGGPVPGLFAGIEALGLDDADAVVVLTCDAPRAARLIGGLAGSLSGETDGVVAHSAGRVQYLLAVYRVGALRRALAGFDGAQGLPMRRLVAGLDLTEVVVDERLAVDLDDPDDVVRWLAGGAGPAQNT